MTEAEFTRIVTENESDEAIIAIVKETQKVRGQTAATGEADEEKKVCPINGPC